MSLLTPSMQALRLNQNWLLIVVNTLPYSGVQPVTSLLLIGFNWQIKFNLLLFLKSGVNTCRTQNNPT